MSYARFGVNSDVYVYLDCGGYLACCACSLSENWMHASTDDVVKHLREHIAAGHVVPVNLIPALEADRDENDAYIAGYERSAKGTPSEVIGRMGISENLLRTDDGA